MSERSDTPPPATTTPWQPASFDAPAPVAPAPDETAPDLASVHATAREAGFGEGWQAGFEEGRETGYDQGLVTGRALGEQTGQAEGYAAGLAEGQATAREHAERLAALTDALAQSLRALEADMGQALITLALAVAQKIVGDTLTHQPDAMLACVRNALRLDANATPLRLWLHPDDLAIVTARLADELCEGDCHIQADASISRGGCRVETAFGEIDATLQTRWQQAITALAGTAGASSS